MVERVVSSKTPPPLVPRITAALDNPNEGSASLHELLAETEAAITAADEVFASESAKAKDIMASPTAEAAQDALARASAAQFNRDRLKSALPKLRDKLTTALEGERHSRWLSTYRRVEAERNLLSDEFAEVYPVMIAQLADLFTRMEQNKLDCAEVNSIASNSLQNENRRLVNAELHARGLKDFSRFPEISKTIALPDCVESDRNLWPPKEKPFGVVFAETMIAPPPPGANWAAPEVTAQRRAEAVREQNHLAQYYASASAQQEERVNREERERMTSATRK